MRLVAAFTSSIAARRLALTRMSASSVGDYLNVDFRLGSGEDYFDTFDQGSVRLVVGNGFDPILHEKLQEVSEFDGEVVPFAHQPNMIADVPSSAAPPGLKEGDNVRLVSGTAAVVTKVTEKTITIDANHPLAGQKIPLSFKVNEVLDKSHLVSATFAGGCFWGLELAYQREPGVVATWVGYTQGEKENPTYEEVCTGQTGHTEAVRVLYDPSLVAYDRLCDLLFDRLGENRYALNRVGNDQGTQYRHGIYYDSDEQLEAATAAFERAQSADEDRPVVTELKKSAKFYQAEDYHIHYLQKGGQSAKKNDEATIRCYG